MLKTESIVSGYGKVMIINDVNIDIQPGEVVSIIGRNGVGKSTFLKTVMGLLRHNQGSIYFDGQDVSKKKSYDRATSGMGYVPQGHGTFPLLTVEENLKMGALINSKIRDGKFDLVYSYFPRLAERREQKAGTMSGGEQAMLSIGRVLMGNPKILLLDEPSEGVQPNIVQQIGDIILKISADLHLTVLLVEQHMGLIRQVSQRGYVIDKGVIIAQLTKEEIANPDVVNSYLTI
jgi:branched-chain amino acid transport system ATP-binding protein